MNQGRPTNRQLECVSRAAFCLTVIVLFANCGAHSPTTPDPDFNEHEWIEVTRIVSGVRGVVLSMPGHLQIEQRPERELWMRGDRALLPAVITQVRNGILEIRLEPGAVPHPGRPTEFVLTTPMLESAELADFGVIRCSNLDTDQLSLRLTDTGALDFPDLSASELRVATGHGGGSVHVSGRVHKQSIELPGVASYDARDLYSSEAEVVLSGSGSATVRVEDRLVVTIVGPGSVYYLGDPEVESTITGTGQVVRIGS